MKLGLRMNTPYRDSLRPREWLLKTGGYKQVPTHCESSLEVDEEWITNVNIIGRTLFPRFHILKVGRAWYIHFDYFLGTQKRTKVDKCPEILEEIERLRKIKLVHRPTT